MTCQSEVWVDHFCQRFSTVERHRRSEMGDYDCRFVDCTSEVKERVTHRPTSHWSIQSPTATRKGKTAKTRGATHGNRITPGSRIGTPHNSRYSRELSVFAGGTLTATAVWQTSKSCEFVGSFTPKKLAWQRAREQDRLLFTSRLHVAMITHGVHYEHCCAPTGTTPCSGHCSFSLLRACSLELLVLGLVHEFHSIFGDIHPVMNASHRVRGAQPTTSPDAYPARGGRRRRLQRGRWQEGLRTHGEVHVSAGFIRRVGGCRRH